MIEAKLERGRGRLATVLVQRGTLKVGQIVVAGRDWGRVRALIDDKGENVGEAGPSTPVEVLGFDSAPDAGDSCRRRKRGRAREITEYRARKIRDVRSAGAGARSSLEQMMKQAAKGGKAKELPAHHQGRRAGLGRSDSGRSKNSATDEVEVRIIHSGPSAASPNRTSPWPSAPGLSSSASTSAPTRRPQQAERDGIEIRYYNIIYESVDEVKAAMSGMLAPDAREQFLGMREIREVFNISKVGKVAGCMVTEGKVERGATCVCCATTW